MSKKYWHRPIQNVIGQGGHLNQIIRKAKELQRLDATVQLYLSDNLRGRCQVANFHDGILVLQSSQVSAMQLHYDIPKLLERLQKHTKLAILKIEVKVAVIEAGLHDYSRTATLPSSKATDSLRSVSDHISDTELKAALKRLAVDLSTSS